MTDDSPVSRRRVLRTVGIGTAVALAGCSGDGNGSDDGDSSSTESTPNGGGGSDSGESSSEDNSGSTSTEDNPDSINDVGRYWSWLGPKMAGAEWGSFQTENTDIIDTIPGIVITAPAQAAATGREGIFTRWAETANINFAGKSVPVPSAATEISIVSFNLTWGLRIGSYDSQRVINELPSDATKQTTTAGHDIYTASDGNEGTSFKSGIGIGDSSIAVVYTAADDQMAVDLVTGIIETGADEAQRYRATSSTANTIATELGQGIYTQSENLGTKRARAVRLRLNGDIINRRAIWSYESADMAAESRLTSNEFITSLQKESDNQAEPRTRNNKFVPYNTIDVSQKDRYVIITGTLPVSELAQIDLRQL